MIGNKLRSWMEAVRPKKKQHRKDKLEKTVPISTSELKSTNHHRVTWKNTTMLDNEKKQLVSDPISKCVRKQNTKSGHKVDAHSSRYSTTNLSSPESAYSTGYSTDGTSPGAPPEYPLNSSKKETKENRLQHLGKDEVNPQLSCSSERLPNNRLIIKSSPPHGSRILNTKGNKSTNKKDVSFYTNTAALYSNLSNNASAIISPRQRNRIRTNPWLPGGVNSLTTLTSCSLSDHQRVKVNSVTKNNFNVNSIHQKFMSPISHRRSLSSSSCSSLGNHTVDYHFTKSLSDDEDCTLNEILGKYDESYIYEKETDILTDSDPTECESDIDTGRDGGDEDDTIGADLDFMDNGQNIEIDLPTENKGHCSYFISRDAQRRRSSRKRIIRRSKDFTEKKRRSGSRKKNHRHEKNNRNTHKIGSKSVGGTPLFFRKSTGLSPPHFQTLYDSQENTFVLINKRDREADLKYKELITQAELIIRTMNINGLSPRRLPGVSNNRVELIKSTEYKEPEAILKQKYVDEIFTLNSSKSPSRVKGTTRFSPKKNHITNFIINNSPVMVRKELQEQTSNRRNLCESRPLSPLVSGKQYQHRQDNYNYASMCCMPPERNDLILWPNKPKKTTPLKNLSNKCVYKTMLSPRNFVDNGMAACSSSDEETYQISKKKKSTTCPQSEPVKRKSYFWENTNNSHGKTVAFELNNDVSNLIRNSNIQSSENVKHHVLLNTIQNLKKNLEDQSASLQQTYEESHHIYNR